MSTGLFQGINVVSITVPDLQRARVFYEDVLGLGTPAYDLPEAGWIEFSTGAPGGNLSITTEGWDPAARQRTTLVFNVQDCHVAHRALTARGVRCEDPITFEGFVTFCTFYDPFGNRLQMCSPHDPAG